MKNKILILSTVVMALFAVMSCEKDELEKKELKLSESALTLSVGETQKVTVVQGNGGYKVGSNANVDATVDKTVISVKGKKAGETNLVVTDKGGKKAQVKVTVLGELVFGETKIAPIKEGEIKSIAISGGSGEFTAKSSEEKVATAEVKDGKVVITAVKGGKATITVTDSKTKKEVAIEITVEEVITDVAFGETKIAPIKEGEMKSIAISGGSGEFTAKSSEEKVATAEVKDGKVVITAVKGGKTMITVTDAKTKKEATIEIAVEEVISDFTFGNGKIAPIKEGESTLIAVSGGSGEFTAKSSDEKVATAEVKDGKVVITGVKSGEATITVVDAKTKKEATVKVTIKAKEGTGNGTGTDADVTLKKEKAEVKGGEKVEVAISGGSGEFTAKSSDEKVATVEIKDGKVVITGVKAGEATITVADAKTKKEATVKVTVKAKEVAGTDITLEKSKIEIKEGEGMKIAVTAGSGEYEATVNPEGKVTVKVDGANVIITGVKAGDVTVTVKDKKTNKEATVTVKVVEVVLDITLEKDEVEVAVGELLEIAITDAGSGSYDIKQENDNVTVAIENGKVKITGVKKGTTNVTVEDTKTGKLVPIAVKVTDTELKVTPNQVSLEKTKKAEVEITGGVPPYTVTPSDDTKATATIKDKNKVEIVAVENGTSTVTVKDSDNKEVEVVVTVAPAQEITFDKKGTDLSGNPTEDGKVEFILGQTGAVTEITVLTGTPPYTVAPEYSWATPKSTFTIDGNKITFTSTTDCSDSYKVTDANGKERALDVKVYKAISVNSNSYEVIVGQEITKKITVKGKADVLQIKSGYDTSIVTASLEGNSSNERDLKLVGGSAGKTTITLTDGVTEVTVDVTVASPKPLQVFKDGVEVGATPYAEDNASFVIKGGIGKYDVKYTLNGAETKLLENATISEVYNEPGSYDLKISRNKGVREGGEVIVTVTRKDDINDSKMFKVTCATLSSFGISIDGVAVPQKDELETPYANPHYVIATGYYGGRYDVYVPVGKTIDFSILNGTVNKYTIKVGSYGSQRGEVIETSDNKTFKVKTKEAGAYYVDVYDETGNKVLDMIVRIQ